MWSGGCHLLGVQYNVVASEEEQNGVYGLKILQSNVKVQNLTYNLFGEVKNGW